MDLDTHGMFICTVTEARVMNDKETMTYTYYQKHVKPKPQTEGKKDSYVWYVDISMKERNFRMIIFVHCASMELRILNRFREKVES